MDWESYVGSRKSLHSFTNQNCTSYANLEEKRQVKSLSLLQMANSSKGQVLAIHARLKEMAPSCTASIQLEPAVYCYSLPFNDSDLQSPVTSSFILINTLWEIIEK